MNSVNPNPYAPPATESIAQEPKASRPSMETLKVVGPIPFAGSVEDGDLREYLRADDNVGCAYLMLLGFVVGLVILVLLAQGGGLAAIAIGMAGLYFTTSIVSTLPYRRLVFENANPDWREFRRGELRMDGVYLDRSEARVFFRWDWYWNAVTSDDWVAFLPATQPLQPLLITRSMLERLDDWQRLVQVAAVIALREGDTGEHYRRQRNFRLLRAAGRPRILEVPSGAIAFEGISKVDDFSRLPGDHRRREKPTRSYVVVGTLLLSGAFIVAGASNLLVQRFSFLPTLVVAYIALASIGIAVRKRRRGRSSDSVVYFLNGYATESSVVSDLGITTNEVAWSLFDLAVQTGDFIALRRRDRGQFLFARRDMFQSEQDWMRFNEIAERNCS